MGSKGYAEQASKGFANKLAKGMEFGSFLQSAGSMVGQTQQQGSETTVVRSNYRAKHLQRRRLR